MKKILCILIVAAALTACSKTPQNQEPEQDYTSFVFVQTIENLLPNCVVGYFDDEGYCWKLADLGDLEHKGQQSEEITVDYGLIKNVFFFADMTPTTRFDKTFTLIKNKKNIFQLSADIAGVKVDVANPKEYPQEKEPQ